MSKVKCKSHTCMNNIRKYLLQFGELGMCVQISLKLLTGQNEKKWFQEQSTI